MSRLLHDRYYAYGPSHAWDLATGESLRVDEIVADDLAEPPPPASLVEALEHGREGEPRWIVADTGTGPRSPVVARRLATEEGILGGISTGANLWAAIEVDKRPDKNSKMIVTVGCSTGERNLSKPLPAEPRSEVEG